MQQTYNRVYPLIQVLVWEINIYSWINETGWSNLYTHAVVLLLLSFQRKHYSFTYSFYSFPFLIKIKTVYLLCLNLNFNKDLDLRLWFWSGYTLGMLEQTRSSKTNFNRKQTFRNIHLTWNSISIIHFNMIITGIN